MTNTTISQNGAGEGGGILHWNSFNTRLNLQSCTISSNQSQIGANRGIVSQNGANDPNVTLHVGNCLIADAGRGRIVSSDYNLIQDTNMYTITGVTAHNIYNQDPKVGPLADLGGPTPTHALRFDSPALDAGHSGGLTTDQRGLPRGIDDPRTPNADGGDASDIGAYEADPNLRLLAPEKIGGDIRLRFNTLFGRTYRLESEDNLNNSWSTLTNNISGTGGALKALDTGAANLPGRFYRAVMFVP